METVLQLNFDFSINTPWRGGEWLAGLWGAETTENSFRRKVIKIYHNN